MTKRYKFIVNFILLTFSNSVYSIEYENKKIKFNYDLMAEFNKNVDISWLESEENPIVHGKHDVKVILNGKKMGVHNIEFTFSKSKAIKPCIPVNMLKKINIKQNLLDSITEGNCIIVEDYFMGSSSRYDYDEEYIEVTLPQIYLKEAPDGYIDPSLWEEGINAFTANYSFSTSNFFQKENKRETAYYANILSILRLKEWRFYSYDTFNGGDGRDNKINHLQAYAKRPIRSLRAELSLGDFSSSGDRFPTTMLRGIAIQTDERMFPWTLKGYAPIISGIAKSNAVVTISQNGHTLYEKNVPPGEFRITDLYALGYGGDLTLQVKESDGKVYIQTVPYSNLPQLLRKGFYKYSLVSGQLLTKDTTGQAIVNEATINYGVSNEATIFGGFQYASDNTYKALNSGLAFNTPLGAISGEMTQSWSQDIEDNNEGNSFKNRSLFKIGLAKLFNQSGTNFNIASYYLSGKNYYSLSDALYKRKMSSNGKSVEVDRYKNRVEVVLSQQLLDSYGNLSLTYMREQGNYAEGNNGKRTSYIFGYRNNYGALSYSVGFNKSFMSNGYNDKQYYINLSMPFGFNTKPRPSLNIGLSYNSDNTTVRTSINGTAQHESSTSSLSSYFSQSSMNGGDFGISLGNTDSYLQKNINYSQGMGGYSLGANLSGGVLIHSDAIQFSSYLPNTLVIVEAKGASGATISGNKHSKIDHRGYGVSGSVTPYQENTILLKTEGASLGFDSNEDSQIVIPTDSSVIKKVFSNKNKRNLVLRIKDTNDRWLPYGTNIYSGNNIIGTLSQSGLAIVSLDFGVDNIKVKGINDSGGFICSLSIDANLLHKANNKDSYEFNIITCK